ncbi:MAG TPA: periplasmic heavy metal sensor [Thermoanaerobaculia bacterium]
MKRILTLALSAALVLGATFAVQAQMHGHGFHGMHGKAGADHTAFLTKALNLTADQQTAVTKLHQDLMAKAQPLMQQHHQQMAEVKALLDGVNPDANEIGQKTIAAHSTMQQMKALHDDFKTKLTALLTPDQKTKLQQMEQAHQGHGSFGGPGEAPEF